ncbi:hypothetical protein [Fibrobacter sp.]|uniref:hypothetical protein n=1 Tax=Fibrobacter sp. TaxID=35828 RepID=UPI00386DB3AF
MSNFTKIVLELAFVVLLINFGISFKSSNPVTQGNLIVFLLIIVYLGYKAFILLCEKINELNKSVKEIEKSILKAECRIERNVKSVNCNDKINDLLFEVARWAISVGGISAYAVQRHFKISLDSAEWVVDSLYCMGVCGPSKENSEQRAMLIGMDELMQLERSGRFG